MRKVYLMHLLNFVQLCLAYHKGKLPANLHYNEPQDQIPAIRDGRIKVLDDHADFDRGFTAMNNFSLTGNNLHVVLKGHYKEKVSDLMFLPMLHIRSCIQIGLGFFLENLFDPYNINYLNGPLLCIFYLNSSAILGIFLFF